VDAASETTGENWRIYPGTGLSLQYTWHFYTDFFDEKEQCYSMAGGLVTSVSAVYTPESPFVMVGIGGDIRLAWIYSQVLWQKTFFLKSIASESYEGSENLSGSAICLNIGLEYPLLREEKKPLFLVGLVTWEALFGQGDTSGERFALLLGTRFTL